MRHKLKELRLSNGQTQNTFAAKTGTTKEYYGLLENGKRVGTLPFWLRVQNVFNLTDKEIWQIAKEGVNIGNKNTTR